MPAAQAKQTKENQPQLMFALLPGCRTMGNIDRRRLPASRTVRTSYHQIPRHYLRRYRPPVGGPGVS